MMMTVTRTAAQKKRGDVKKDEHFNDLMAWNEYADMEMDLGNILTCNAHAIKYLVQGLAIRQTTSV